MVFQGLDLSKRRALWRPFLDWITASPQDFTIDLAVQIVAAPARKLLGPDFLKGFPAWCWPTTGLAPPRATSCGRAIPGEAGQFLHGYQSLWLPASLLQEDGRVASPMPCSRRAQHWGVALHVNKGLAGAPAEAWRRRATRP